jgi:SAM-dependent methyltransferase
VNTKLNLECRLCGSQNLFEVINLGFTPLADRFLRVTDPESPYVYYELILMQCAECGWNQLSNVVDSRILYQEDYPYDASVTLTGSKHWNKFASDSFKQYGLPTGTKVIDIGSNVGALLSSFRNLGAECLGIDPSATAAEKAIKSGIKTKVDFFTLDLAREIIDEFGTVDIVTGTNVVAHVDDLPDFFSGINLILNPGGVFQFEAPYFRNLVSQLQFDTIYHEHLSYLTIKPMVAFLSKFNLEIIRIQEYDIHGGSLRIDIARNGVRTPHHSVADFLQLEIEEKLSSRIRMSEFAGDVRKLRREIRKTILDIHATGKNIAIASAPAKGMTLLHYCGLNHEDFLAISDSADQKKGKLLPGIMVRVSTDIEMLEQAPDYILILAWNFKEEIISNLKKIFPPKTKYIIPIPKVEVI